MGLIWVLFFSIFWGRMLWELILLGCEGGREGGRERHEREGEILQGIVDWIYIV